MQQQIPGAEQQQPAAQGQPQTGQQPVDDKQRELQTIFVSQGIKLAQTMAEQAPKDETAIAIAMVKIIQRLESEGEKNGLKFDLPILVGGAQEILINLLSLMGMEVTEEQAKKIVGIMVGKYIDEAIKSGRMTKEQVQALGEQAQQINPAQGGQQAPQGLLGGIKNG